MTTPVDMIKYNVKAKQRLLTIAIPTFNRSGFLSRLLGAIEPQLKIFASQVEILICDNFSQDDTQEVVRAFEANGLPMTYVRHSENLGMDRNILECFKRASTEYVWIFGDDDVLLEGALATLIPFLEQTRFAHIFVAGYSFRDKFKRKKILFQNIGPTRLTDSADMLRTANTLLMFISRNIINKRAVYSLDSNAAFEDYIGSIINQLGLIFAALRVNWPCLIIAKQIVAAQMANSGGYGSCTVFGENLMTIVTREFPKQPAIHRLFANAVLEQHFPYQLNFLKQTNTFLQENQYGILKRVFNKNYRFWLYCYPIIILPSPIAGAYSFCVRLILKFKRVVLGSIRYWTLAIRFYWIRKTT